MAWRARVVSGEVGAMSLGSAPRHETQLPQSTATYCEGLSETSLYRLLRERGEALFPDESFADLFADIGRHSVPPRIVATVMVLQRFEGLSDREAVDRFAFDLRWKYAAMVDLDFPGFVHTVLVDMRARLRGSSRPNRIFEATLEMAKSAGLVGRKRVLDSTALYDAVATQDTVTMIRGAIRKLLSTVDKALASELRGVLTRDDDYVASGKPICDWDDEPAREALIDGLARDAYAVLAFLHGRELSEVVKEAAALVARVVGQDLEQREDGLFRIARRVAPDRVISVVDPEARHGHKTAARGFDGYKGHIAIDPDSEIITAVAVTAGNVGDATAAPELLKDILRETSSKAVTAPGEGAAESNETDVTLTDARSEPTDGEAEPPVEIYGDASYGSAELLELIENGGAAAEVKVQPPCARIGQFTQDKFTVDIRGGTVTCPNGVLVQLQRYKGLDSAYARFGAHCTDCPMRAQCTDAKAGRIVNVHAKHELLDRHRKRHAEPANRKRYRETRPKVERKLAHLMRRKHGGRRSRVRGTLRIGHDFALLAAATNLARFAKLAGLAVAKA